MNLTRQVNAVTDCGKEKLSYLYAKHYSPIEHLVFDETVVLFRDIVIFKQHM
jgi:hypothetical protein